MKTDAISKHEILKEKSRRISIREGGAYGLFDGFGLRYITPYALLLGMSNVLIGPLIALPQMLGSLMQLVTLKLLEKGIRRKNISWIGTLLQTSMWFPIIFLGILHFNFNLSGGLIPAGLILFYSLMIIFGTMVGPAWSSWMGDIVPQQIGAYFGRRNRILGLITICAMLIAGLILQYFNGLGRPFPGFVIIFLIAFVGRATSSALLKRQYEPAFHPQKEYYFTIWQFIRKIPQSNFGKFVTYVALMQFAVYISAPFFAVFMLKDLHFNYLEFTLITMTMPFVNMLLMPAWGRFADRYGNLRVVRVCGFCIPIIPALWVLAVFFVDHPWLVILYLILIETLSGFAWAGFNLTTVNFIYDAVTRQRMAICVAYYNIFNGVGMFLGGLIGGQIADLPFR
ncbi:MAG: MFS transporter, partial [Candidatus Neomarinimicrobiota bacterium]